MTSIGVTCLSLSVLLFLAYFLLPYEQYRRMKIKLYRENIAEFETRFENVGEQGKSVIAEATPELLRKAKQSFTCAWPAATFACIGVVFVLVGCC